MKSLQLLTFSTLFFICINAAAQTDVPKGTIKGTIMLSDSSVVSGYFKEKIHSNASLTLMGDDNKKKKTYDGSDLISAEVGDEKFICIKGDFFKVISDGKLKFLQKASDASSKPIYNGNQAIFTNGTPGTPGDYFIYNNTAKELKLVNRKSVAAVAEASFAGCDEALTKAKSVNGDVAKLNEAVDIYNSRNRN
ncbi:MAG: hypothetical protein ABI480_10600 [Chitinophagaceae bacterium]